MSETKEKEEKSNGSREKRQKKRRLAKRVKSVVLVLLGLALVGSIVVSFLPKPVEVTFSEVTRGPMRVTVDEDGKTQAKNRYVLSAPLSGNMNRIRLEAGDHVEEGAPILRIVPATPPLLDIRTKANAQTRLAGARAASELAGAEIDRATAALQQAQREAKKLADLEKAGVSSRDEVEVAEFVVRTRTEEFRAAQFSAKVRRQDEASARAALGLLDKRGGDNTGLDISAPVSGEVLRVLRQDQQGLVVAGSPLIEIADLSAMEIVADILTADAVHIKPGAKAKVVRWGGSVDLVGHVNRVEPSAFTRVSALGVEEQRVLVIIDLDSPREQWESLGDGYRVEVEISVWESEDVLTVPASAVFRHEGEWAVYEVREGTAHLTKVQVGHRNDLRVEILDGLTAGATVVTHPSDQVVDGVEVVASGQ
jgi:HlyD family secretion protein